MGSFFFSAVASWLIGIEDAALAVHPAFFARAEQAIEKPVRDHLRRQRAFISGPAHVALHALAERFLRDADLQRAEAGVAAELRRRSPGRWKVRSGRVR